MIKRKFSDVKVELSRVAGQTGMKATDDRVKELVSLAQERLCVLGEWPYQYARVKFRQFGGIVSLPCEYEALVHTTVNREPLALQPSWFEFLEFGPGPTDQSKWANVGVDLGESPVYRQPNSDGVTIKVTTTGADTSTVTVEGYDIDGIKHSVDLVLPQATSAIKWSKISSVTKSRTAGDVVLSYTDGFGEEYVAAVYRARDTNPTFRAYRFPIDDDDSALVHGVVRRRLFPVVADSDELFITNLAALRLGVKAVASEDEGKLVDSEAAFGIARGILISEAKLYKASQHSVAVAVTKIGALSGRPDIY